MPPLTSSTNESRWLETALAPAETDTYPNPHGLTKQPNQAKLKEAVSKASPVIEAVDWRTNTFIPDEQAGHGMIANTP